MEWFYSLMFSRNENNSLIIGDFRSVSFLKIMDYRLHHLQQIGNLIRDFDLPVKTITQKLEQFLMPRGGSQACQRGFAECSALGITFWKKNIFFVGLWAFGWERKRLLCRCIIR